MGFVATICIIYIVTLQTTCQDNPFPPDDEHSGDYESTAEPDFEHSRDYPFTADPDLTFIAATYDTFCPKDGRCGYINVTKNMFNISSRITVKPPPVLGESCCKSCSCDPQSCLLNGSCCPDALEQLLTAEDTERYEQITCRYPQFKPFLEEKIPNAQVAFMMYTKCPFNSDVTSDIISKCVQSDLYDDLDTKIPVTDTSDMKIYLNRYCAYCHHVSEKALKYWEISLKCIRDTYIPSNINDVVRDIRTIKDCNLIFGDSWEFIQTVMQSVCPKTIGTCNETGHWATYDPVLEAACLAYGGRYFKYKNVYCYLCNTDDKEAASHCFDIPGHWVTITFSALLNFTPDKKDMDQGDDTNSENVCEQNHQLFDSFKDMCRNISCLPPKIFRNESCHNTIDYLTGVEYEVFLKMTPTQNISRDDLFDAVSALESHSESMFAELKFDYALTEFDIFYKMNQVLDHSIVDLFVIYFKFYSPPIRIVYLSSIDGILMMDNRTQTIETHNGHTIIFYAELEVYEILNEPTNTRIYGGADNITLDKIFTSEFRSTMFPEYVSMVIVLTRQIGCPLVSIGKDEFTITNRTWGVTIHELNTTLKRNEYIYSAKIGSFLICTDLYTQLLPAIDTNNESKSKTEENVNEQVYVGLVSVVCTSVSVFLALMTLLTYSLFKSLRTQPGINNMCLLVSLICAQVLFQFGSGQARFVSSVVCQVIGMSVHFSWLMTVFWMNACSYHMYKVFSNKFVVGATGHRNATLRYCLFCCLSSAVPVSINIAVVALNSNGKDIGYGGATCYISRRSMVGYVFAIPVGLVILCNLIMFIIVITRLARTPKLDKHSKRNRNFFVIYAKISTLTGIAWLFGFVYHFSGLVAFEYTFIILNAGQGLFIFLAFVWNRRVAGLFRALVSTSQETSTGSSSNNGSGRGIGSANGSLETALELQKLPSAY